MSHGKGADPHSRRAGLPTPAASPFLRIVVAPSNAVGKGGLWVS